MGDFSLDDHVLLSTRSGEADDGGALAGTETAFGAGDSTRIRRADHNGTTFWRLRVLLRFRGENYGNGSNAEISKLIGMSKRVATEVYGEAVCVSFFDAITIYRIRKHIVVRECKATPVLVCIHDGAERRDIDRDPVVTWQVASDVVAPERARLKRTHNK